MSGWCVCGVCKRELYNIKISDECTFALVSKAERKFIHSSALITHMCLYFLYTLLVLDYFERVDGWVGGKTCRLYLYYVGVFPPQDGITEKRGGGGGGGWLCVSGLCLLRRL